MDANIYRTLSGGHLNRPQASLWRNGYLYTSTHVSVIKSYVGFADEMADNYPVYTGNTVWHHPDPTVPGQDYQILEQITYNPDANEIYLGDRDYKGVLTAEEKNLDVPYTNWDQFSRVAGGPESSKSIEHDSSVVSSMQLLRNVIRPSQEGWVETWVYDDASATQRVYICVTPSTDALDGYILAINTNETGVNGDTNYVCVNNADSVGDWQDTGISRVPTPQWVKFGFDLKGDQTVLYVSKTRGRSWEEAARFDVGTHEIRSLGVRSVSGQNPVNSWRVEPY
jgi:hypothetical protein